MRSNAVIEQLSRMLPQDSISICTACLANRGLCRWHAVSVLPQLAVNLGWLRLMGEPRTEQIRRQDARPSAAIEKAKRRETRKAKRFAWLRSQHELKAA